jgi:hypothetical protein
MAGSFKLVALDAVAFAGLFEQSDAELAAMGARRMVVDTAPGFPCRVTLADAAVGETVVLLPHLHHDVASPYRASGPIYVRQGGVTATPAIGEIPVMFRHRLLSLRAYDATGMMLGADVVQGTELEDAMGRLFEDEQVDYLPIHNAKPGCFNCRVERA